MNRKAIAMKWADLLFGVLTLAVLFILFSLYFGAKESNIMNQIEEKESRMWAVDDLLVVMQQPVDFDFDNDGTVERGNLADLLDYSYQNNDYQEFKKILDGFLTPKYQTHSSDWRIKIYRATDNKKVKGLNGVPLNCFRGSTPLASLLVPVEQDVAPLRVVLFLDLKSPGCVV